MRVDRIRNAEARDAIVRRIQKTRRPFVVALLTHDELRALTLIAAAPRGDNEKGIVTRTRRFLAFIGHALRQEAR